MDEGEQASRRLTQITGRFLSSTPRISAERQLLARDSPLKRFPINRDNRSIEQIKESAVKGAPSSSTVHNAYYAFMQSNQGGVATIASDNHRALFAVKSIRRTFTEGQSHIKIFKNDHVVSLLDVYHVEGQIRMVYELMFVSLRNITSTPRGNLRVFEIQAICKEVVSGLVFIHRELRLYHSLLGCDQIMLDLHGHAKIANIGDSMINLRHHNKDSEREDLLGLRRIMLELMEPRVTRLAGDEELSHPEEWMEEEGIMDFLRATTTDSLDSLCKHIFLPQDYSIRGYLKELVVVALFTASTMHQHVFTPRAVEAQGSELWS